MSDSDAKDNHSDSNSRDSICKRSRLNAPLRTSVLRPSLFTTTTNSDSSTNTLSSDKQSPSGPSDSNATTSNPFLKDDLEQQEIDQEKDKKDEKNDKDLKNDPLAMLSKNGLQRSNLFAATKNSIPRVEQSGFVFGQNVHERVTGAAENIQTSSKQDNETNKESTENDDSKDAEGATAASTSSTTNALLFSSAIQNCTNNNKSGGNDMLGATSKDYENQKKSLTEVAREYEESRAQKRKYEEVETFTGEENEVNIIDINCKLFAFINRNWEERGRGSLRLNDSKDENGCSRVVFRTSGNLRLLVNTKVWNGMVAERPSQKSLRLTAMDNTGQIKVFLIMSRPDDIGVLYKALTKRIEDCKNNSLTKENNTNGDGNDNQKYESVEKIEENEQENESPENEKTKDSKNDDNDGKNDDNDGKNDDDDGKKDDDKYEPSPKKSVVVNEN